MKTRVLLVLTLALPLVAQANSVCEAHLTTPFVSLVPRQVTADGRTVLTIDYSTEKSGQRQIELPAVVAKLRGQKKLRVAVLAGNSGAEYASTRHSLGHAFGDFMLKTVPHRTSERDGYKSRETVTVGYDDGSTRAWTTDFVTEVPQFRTATGEVMLFPELDLLVVRMIGDYNEVGDFAIPILDALELSPQQLVLIHDDLTLKEGEVQLTSGVQKYNGNNAQFSLMRNLAYALYPQVAQTLGAKVSLPEDKWQEFEAIFRSKADVRYAGHLGQPRAFESAFKSVDSVMTALMPMVNEVEVRLSTPLKQELQTIRAKLSEIRKPLGAIMPELNRPDVTPERRAELETLRDAIQLEAKPWGEKVKSLESRIQSTRKELLAEVRALVEARLTFARISIGTDNGAMDRADLAKFVLSPYPTEVFTTGRWEQVLAALKTW